MKDKTYAHIEELRQEFVRRKEKIRQRIAEFAGIAPEERFFELVYCLLTPQSSAVHAGLAVRKLRAAGEWQRVPDVARILREKDSYIRFHNAKAAYLRDAAAQFPEITAALSDGRTSRDLREWLVGHVNGMGWKEASHFLRNIGHRDLAILDRHILRNLKRHGVIRTIPRTLTPRRYLAIEEKFLKFSEAVGMSMDELDLLFWSRETGEILK